MNNTPRNNSPELRPKSEAMLERSQLIEASAPYFEAILSAEFRWDQAARPVQGTEAVINKAFLEMQPKVREAIDELPA